MITGLYRNTKTVCAGYALCTASHRGAASECEWVTGYVFLEIKLRRRSGFHCRGTIYRQIVTVKGGNFRSS